jgi:drug/metabolite transporter (DMT)-like permease
MALGSLLWYRGVQRVAATTAAGFMGVMPVSAVLLSYLLLGEPFSFVHLAGMAAVLGGVAAVARSHAEG